MHRETLVRRFTLSLLFLSLVMAKAEERGYWRAASNTARSVTGDVTLSNEKITINFSTMPMSRIRPLEPAEVSAVFDMDSATAAAGSLYRLIIPAEKKFLHKNSLCGAEDVQWMAASARGNSLQIAFFSGGKPPVFTFEAIQNTTDLCGVYSYVK